MRMTLFAKNQGRQHGRKWTFLSPFFLFRATNMCLKKQLFFCLTNQLILFFSDLQPLPFITLPSDLNAAPRSLCAPFFYPELSAKTHKLDYCIFLYNSNENLDCSKVLLLSAWRRPRVTCICQRLLYILFLLSKIGDTQCDNQNKQHNTNLNLSNLLEFLSIFII